MNSRVRLRDGNPREGAAACRLAQRAGQEGPERGETIWDGEQGEGWAVTMVGIADAAEDGGGEICCLLATGEEEPECPTTPPGIETALVLR